MTHPLRPRLWPPPGSLPDVARASLGIPVLCVPESEILREWFCITIL